MNIKSYEFKLVDINILNPKKFINNYMNNSVETNR